MRITIETGEELASLQATGQEAVAMGDGGAPASDLLAGLGTSDQLAAPGGAELADAGSPPEWLLQAVTQAFEQDPGRFDDGAGARTSDVAIDAGGPEAGDETSEAPLSRAREEKRQPDPTEGEEE
jgi:hypothetical protein